MDNDKLIRFLGFWIATSVMLLICSAIFGNNVVLGNDRVSGSMAAVFAGFILTGINYLVPKALAKSDFKVKKESQWAIIFLISNAIVVWIIKRLAQITGLGISSILYVVVVAILVTVAQWAVDKVTELTLKK